MRVAGVISVQGIGDVEIEKGVSDDLLKLALAEGFDRLLPRHVYQGAINFETITTDTRLGIMEEIAPDFLFALEVGDEPQTDLYGTLLLRLNPHAMFDITTGKTPYDFKALRFDQ